MTFMLYTISDLVLDVQGGSDELSERMAGYALSPLQRGGRSCDIKILVEKKKKIALPAGEPMGRSGIWKLMRTEVGYTVYRILPGFDDMVSVRMDFQSNEATLSLLSLDDDNRDRRDFIFAGQAFSNLILTKDRIVLHGSCIAYRGKAIIFSAPSGTGKSTHTGLWAENLKDVIYINDDTPVVDVSHADGAVFACGSPWSGKNQKNTNVIVPLCAVVFLERGTENEICPIGKTEAMARLLGEVRKLPLRCFVERAAENCGKLICRVPVYRLRCNISYDAVETVRRELSL